jgi:hypothetical protein
MQLESREVSMARTDSGRGRTIATIVFAILVAIQFVPVDTTNPPVETEVPAPAEVATILERSCYDCHSNRSRWPWYSRVAPVSWLVAHDVAEAREHLNFSEWNRLDAKDQAKALEEIWEEVEEGEMPLWFYLPLHPEARLSPGDLERLRGWTGGGDGHASPEHDHD